MSKNAFLKRLKETVSDNRVNLICAIVVALLTGACSGEYKKQISPYPYLTFKVSAKGESRNGDRKEYQTIECRTIVGTGIKMKTKYCATIEQLSYLNETGLVSSKSALDSGEDEKDQEIECRYIVDPETNVKTRYCAAKSLWAHAYVGESYNSEVSEDQKIECHVIVHTGTKLKTKYCALKGLWDIADEKNNRDAQDLINDIIQRSALANAAAVQ
jgi:hypothetical protein